MKLLALLLSFSSLALLSSCELDGLDEVSTCSTGAVVATQGTFSGQLVLEQNKPVAQSFYVNCSEGILNSVDLKISSAAVGLLGKVKVEVYAEGDNGSFGSYIDEGTIENIPYSPVNTYTVTFSYGTKLLPGNSYWLVITSLVANNVILRTSGPTDYYAGAGLWLTDPSWQQTSAHKDAFFSVKVR